MKKSANLNRYRFIFFELGLIVALSLSLMAFRIEGTDQSVLGSGEEIMDSPCVQIDSHTEYVPPKKKQKVIKRRKRVDTDDLRNLKLVDNSVLLKPIIKPKPKLQIPLKAAGFVSHKLVKPDVPVKFPDEMPEFPGGASALMKFLKKEVIYPRHAEEVNAEGAVVLSFVIDEEGNITQIKVEKDEVGFGCAEEAIRAIKKMPKWKPGILNGEKVKTQFLQKIRFELSF